MHRKVAAAIVAALALAVASCGGSGTTTLSRAELVRQVEVACREGQREGEKQARASRGSGGTGSFVDAILANQKLVMERIDNLEASGAAKADWETFKSSMQTRLDAIERVAAADRADQQRVIRSVQSEIEAVGRRMQAASRSLGITGCI